MERPQFVTDPESLVSGLDHESGALASGLGHETAPRETGGWSRTESPDREGYVSCSGKRLRRNRWIYDLGVSPCVNGSQERVFKLIGLF